MAEISHIVRYRPDNFNPVYYPYLKTSRPTEIFYGGSSSGKSNFIAHRVILDILDGGRNYLCIRKVSNTVTKSVFNELYKAIIDFGVSALFNIVPSQGHITCKNGFQILFAGMDDPEKVKSITPRQGILTDIWFEEATEAAYDDVKQLRKRLRGISVYRGEEVTKRIILSFNPIYRTHWIVKEYFDPSGWKDDSTYYEDDNLRILKTTYKDNVFLTDQDRQALEDERDPYWYDVYTLGNWGILGDVIFQNWKIEDIDNLVHGFDNIRNGLDFGFSNDPTAYTRSHYDAKRKRIYIFDSFKVKGMTNPEIADKLKPIIGQEPIWCDSAEPKSIQELKDLGINARPAKKGKDSILHGIQWLQQQEIIISHRCQDVSNEFILYQWDKDKDGESINKPVDRDNHFIDSIRYSYNIDMGPKVYDWAA